MDDDESTGVPEWVVTYGDMMSLLLTFFIMLVALSEVVAEDKYRAILDAIQEYVGYRTAPEAPPGPSFPLNNLIAALDSLGSYTPDDSGRGGVRVQGVEGETLRVLRTREGKRVRVGRPVVFPEFEAGLTEQGRRQLAAIAVELAGIPNKVVIRGHTASHPLPADSPFPDKFTLSYERSRNVFQFLKAHGVDYSRMRISALADGEPPPPSGDRQVLRADRVEIVLLDAFAEEFVAPQVLGE